MESWTLASYWPQVWVPCCPALQPLPRGWGSMKTLSPSFPQNLWGVSTSLQTDNDLPNKLLSWEGESRAQLTAKSLQSCPTLWDPRDGSPPGSLVPGILQARTLEWVAIAFSNVWKVKVKSLSRIWLSATPWTAAYQAPLSMGFSRQEYWSGVPLLLFLVLVIYVFPFVLDQFC